MNGLDRLANGLETRRKNLLKELSLVHVAIEHSKRLSNSSVTAVEWLNKLEKWADDLHKLIDSLPHMDQK